MEERKKIQDWVWDVLLIAAAFVLWAHMFRAYLSGKAILDSDAVSYYDHIKFYIDNLSKGVFPLWDPAWFCGASNTFFLQRMGCFNPFLFLILFFKGIGFSHTTAYLIYLMCYYFAGCLGFYFLARCVIKDRICAFAVFALLLFSALGTRIFDSFMILMFTPTAWFFYFLVAFSQKPKRYAFVGLIFTLITVVTTYIPFFFLLTVISFLFFYVMVYGATLKTLVPRYLKFIGGNKFLVVICSAVLLASLMPGYLFFKAGGKGDYVMPKRNSSQAADSVLGVQAQDGTNSWALLEELFFAYYYYTDIVQIPFAVIYVPLFAVVVFFLGLLTKINRKVLLLFVWIAGLLLICIPMASPIYSFLYKHIPFFKYFRNLHFFLWVAILPATCLLLGEQLKSYMAWSPSGNGQRWAAAFYIVLVHAAPAWFLWQNGYPVETSYFVLMFSAVFFLWRLFGSLSKKEVLTMAVVLLVTALEPWQIYGYLSRNTEPYKPYSYAYDTTSMDFRYTRIASDIDQFQDNSGIVEEERRPEGRVIRGMESFYYASKWFTYLSMNVDMYVVLKYRGHKFVVYDEVQKLDDGNPDFAALETALAENRNVAFVSTDDPAVLKVKPPERVSYYARKVDGPGPDFRVDGYTANSIRIQTNFNRPQFVVYNDNEHKEWRLYVNGRQQPVIRSNVAFKGLWVSAGEQTVEFKYGLPQTWLMYMVLFVGISGMFVWLVLLAWRELRGCARSEISQGVTD